MRDQTHQNRVDHAHPGSLDLSRDVDSLLRTPGDSVFLAKVTSRFELF